MHQIVLNGENILTRQDAHKLFAEALRFPDWYGGNLDALHDMLTEQMQDVTIRIENLPLLDEHLGDYAVYLLRVLEDCAEENARIHLKR